MHRGPALGHSAPLTSKFHGGKTGELARIIPATKKCNGNAVHEAVVAVHQGHLFSLLNSQNPAFPNIRARKDRRLLRTPGSSSRV